MERELDEALPALAFRHRLNDNAHHRILAGADAARFLQDVRARLENPLRLAL